MEVLQKDFSVNTNDQINIYTLGDIHEGNVNHAEAEFKEAIKIIKNDPIGYWIGMGDYIEAITPSDKKRFDPTSVSQKYKIKDLKNLPNKQMDYVFENLKCIQNKCLCLLTGNHEETFSKHNENDVFDHFVNLFTDSAYQPGQKPPKIGYTGFIKLRFNSKGASQRVKRRTGKTNETETMQFSKIVIYCNHGDGGTGMREGYGVNKIHDVTRGIEADINIMGHIHLLQDHSQKITELNCVNGLRKRMKYWGLTGCFLYTYLEGNSNYFEHKGRAESPIGMLKINIKVKRYASPIITLTKIQLG